MSSGNTPSERVLARHDRSRASAAPDTQRAGARREPAVAGWSAAVKRMIDVLGAALLLLACAPLFAIVAAWIKLDSAGPVIYGHERIGRHGRPFQCLKFRSMREDAQSLLESDPELHRAYVENNFKLPARLDPRLTRSGRFLRRTSLDEVPQLVNVLRGEMSLVGPRPVVAEEVSRFNDPELLLSVRPGITGAWATHGRNTVGYPERARIELDYVRNWSLSRDLVVLLKTIPALFRAHEAR